jgi:hypothetical protein
VTTEKVPYVYRDEKSYGSTKIDMPRFAADIAKAIGGELLPPGDYPHERQFIRVGKDKLDLAANTWKKRVNVSIEAPDVAWGDWSTYDKTQRTESASVNPDGRSIAAIAKDLKKRVVEANQAALAARRAYAAQQKQNRADIVARAAALKAACPNLTVNVNEREQNATIYSGPSQLYLSGRLDSRGRVQLDRLDYMSIDAFKKIIAILEGDECSKTS